MDENLKIFLENFAELERRIRKFGVEDRSLRDEVNSLSERLELKEAEARMLREVLSKERTTRHLTRDRLGGLIEKLDGLRKFPGGNAEAFEGEC